VKPALRLSTTTWFFYRSKELSFSTAVLDATASRLRASAVSPDEVGIDAEAGASIPLTVVSCRVIGSRSWKAYFAGRFI
jgi:hypothetical protein